MDDVKTILRGSELFATLPDAVVDLLAPVAVPRQLAPGPSSTARARRGRRSS